MASKLPQQNKIPEVAEIVRFAANPRLMTTPVHEFDSFAHIT
jgi:hypothetical protein